MFNNDDCFDPKLFKCATEGCEDQITVLTSDNNRCVKCNIKSGHYTVKPEIPSYIPPRAGSLTFHRPTTEGIKHDAGKPKLSILTRESLAYEAAAFEYGATKYGRDNYKAGMDWTRLLDACLRHVTAFNSKEDMDPESGLNHLAHAKACIAMLIYYYENKLGKDDR